MYINYVVRRKADHANLAAALSLPSGFEQFKIVGHQIKGNASSFGFDDLVAIGERMEKITATNQDVDGPRLLAEFWTWILAAEKKLELGLSGDAGS